MKTQKPKTGGDRHNGFGATPTETGSALAKALDLTRAAVKQQGASAGFTGADKHETKTWTCTSGHDNPLSKSACRYCGEVRA